MNSADGLAGALIGAKQIEPGSDFMKQHPNHGQITRCAFNRCSGALPSFSAQSITIGPGLRGILAINA